MGSILKTGMVVLAVTTAIKFLDAWAGKKSGETSADIVSKMVDGAVAKARKIVNG